jgi:hypothetical protein
VLIAAVCSFDEKAVSAA